MQFLVLVDLIAYSLECIVLNWCWNIMQEVPPLHLTEIVAYLVRQSGPFLDQLGIRRGMKNHCLFGLSSLGTCC